jgi:hypothetical protein
MDRLNPSFTRAVEEFLRRYESQALLESLNRVYEDFSPTPEEKEARRLMKQKQRERVKGNGDAKGTSTGV